MNDESAPGFVALDLKPSYRSGESDVVSGFYLPTLGSANEYCRAVGYFTSASMTLLAKGIGEFERRGGLMRVVASPQLETGDIEAIEQGYAVRDVLGAAALRTIDRESDDELLTGLSVVGRLIANGLLDIKLAFVHDRTGYGIYHEKIGYFVDQDGSLVSFTGSANETYGGLVSNFESIEVFRSWVEGDSERAQRIKDSFDELWEGTTNGLSIIDFPDVAKERLVALSEARPAATVLPVPGELLAARTRSSQERLALEIPDWLAVRDYQKSAVESWLGQGGRGVLKMATGTGKTKTALMAAAQIFAALEAKGQRLVVVVAAPYQHLVDQWIDEIAEFGSQAIGIYESSAKWESQVRDQLTSLSVGNAKVVTMVATNASLALPRFQAVINEISSPLMFIGDEAHNLGSDSLLGALPSRADYRLALSATPERWFDDTGTAALTAYFGEVVFELGIGQAIEMGALCRYEYFPRIIELSPEETHLYVEITNKIAPLLRLADQVQTDGSPVLGMLLRKRAAVVGHAQQKLEVLESDLRHHRNDWHQLIYCAEGCRPAEEGVADEPTQVAQVMQIVGHDLTMSAQKYVATTTREERRRLLARFGTGEDLQALVSMRCLDEGVDVPDARIAYLIASSSNPRQFIQRRGRILRPAAGKDRATIYDYVVVPSPGSRADFGTERRLLGTELSRIAEFGKISENYGATLELLRPYKQQYQLMDL